MKRLKYWLRLGEPATTWAQWAIGSISFTVFACGLWWHNASLLGVGAVVLVALLRFGWSGAERERASERVLPRIIEHHHAHQSRGGSDPASPPLPKRWLGHPEFAELPESTDALVEEMLSSGRYALLLRPEMNRHLDREHITRAVRHLDDAMALVPAGRVLLCTLAEQSTSSSGAFDADPKMLERFMYRVETIYLDRHTVTNNEFQQFVDAGGYEKLEYWEEEALPALLDFVDETGQPGPRFWIEGQYRSGEGRQPVVGVSWYEASAFARWVGKRLPTDAEWTKAGAWPVESAPGRIAQRRYPWGESFDIRRANLWGSHRKGPVDVDEYSDGESVGGVHQLVGNVWEWTGSPLHLSTEPSLHVPETFKSVRGGAFDTYFENQATCHYESGEHPLARRHNIGFRLALPMSTLVVAEEPDNQADGTELPAEETSLVAQTEEALAAAH